MGSLRSEGHQTTIYSLLPILALNQLVRLLHIATSGLILGVLVQLWLGQYGCWQSNSDSNLLEKSKVKAKSVDPL